MKFKDIASKVLDVPINDVIETMLNNRPERKGLVNRPGNGGFLCPFHDDHTGGHFFTYTDKKGVGRYKCFVCGSGPGSSIDFVKQLNNCGFKEAVLDTAVSLSIISKNEYKEKTNKEFTQAQRSVSTLNINRVLPATMQDKKIINIVYNILSQGDKLVGISDKKLRKSDYKYLRSRGISLEEINGYGYFTMYGDEAMPQILSQMSQYGLSERDLVGIPGFYRDKTTNRMHLVSMEGIGIPIRNELGLIHTIQVRAREAEAKPRYKFLSSSFVTRDKFKNTCSDGCGPEHTISVVSPLGGSMNGKYVCVTEGQFKATQFAATVNDKALSVQGVNNTKDVIPVLDALDKSYHFKKDVTVVLAFDMDMLENVHVFKASQKLSRTLRQAGWNVAYMYWDKQYKGLDDFLIAKKQGNVSSGAFICDAETYEHNAFAYMAKNAIKERYKEVADVIVDRDEVHVFSKGKDYENIFVVKEDNYVGFLKQVNSGRLKLK